MGQLVAAIIALAVILALIFGAAYFLDMASAEKSRAEAAEGWARVAQTDAQKDLNAQRSDDFRKDMILLTTIMHLSGGRDMMLMGLGAVAGAAGMVIYRKVEEK